MVFGKKVDIVTCNLTSQGNPVVALAYTVEVEGARIEAMQTSDLNARPVCSIITARARLLSWPQSSSAEE
jgi:hypothetical protein